MESDLPQFRVVAIPGDGVGPEVVAAARRVVDAAGARFRFAVEWTEILAGGIAIDTHGVAIRPADVEICRAADAVLLGAVGGPNWSDPSAAFARSRRCSRFVAGLGYSPISDPSPSIPPWCRRRRCDRSSSRASISSSSAN